MTKRARFVLYGLGLLIAAALLAWAANFGGAARSPLVVRVPADHAADVRYTSQRAEPAVARAGNQPLVAGWSFGEGIPTGWELGPNARAAERRGMLRLVTGSSTDIAMQSRAISLSRGTYRVLVDGAVKTGGLQLSVETAEQPLCRGAAYFDRGSVTSRHAVLPVTFTTDGQSPLRIVLANWSAREKISVWDLNRVEVVRQSTSGVRATIRARYERLASPLVRLIDFPVLNQRFRWDFLRGVPQDWLVAPHAHVLLRPEAAVVDTTRDRYGFIFTMQLQLGRGPYLFRFDGKIQRERLMLGAFDTRRKHWVDQRFYWYGQRRPLGVTALPFTLERPTTVELIVGNWSVVRARSRWLLRSLELDQRF